VARNISSQRKMVQPILYYSTSLSKDKKIKETEDGRVLQSGLSCADKVKPISVSTKFRLLQSIMKENLSFWVTLKNPPFKA
jgi:hypothetical protein